MRRASGRAVLALCIVASAALGACKKQPSSSLQMPRPWAQIPEPPANGPSAWAQVLAHTDENGRFDREGALQAYSLMFSPLPGVSNVPALDRSVGGCANPVLHALNQHRASLTEAQRNAIDRTLSPARARPARSAALIEAWYDDDGIALPDRPAHRARVDRVTATLRDVATAMEARAHRTVTARVKVQLVYDANASPAAAIGEFLLGYQHTAPDEMSRPTRSSPFCRVVVSAGAIDQPDKLRMMMAHEYFHCMQFEAFDGTWAQFDALPVWMFEGPAAYAGESVGGPSVWDALWWGEYFLPANRSATRAVHGPSEFVPGSHYQLYRSGYDAIGYFASLASAGAQVWEPAPGRTGSRILEIINAGSPNQTLAISLGWNAGAPSTVASAAARQPWSPAWNIHDPALQSDLGAGPRARVFDRQRAPINMAAIHRSLQEGEMALLEATCADKPLVKITASGAGRVRVGEVEESFWSPRFETFVCRTPPCACPNGRPMLVSAANTTPDAVYRFALLATSPTAHVSAEAVTYDEVCPPDQPPNEIDPCLIGTWRLEADSFRQSFASAFPSVQGNVRLDTMVETLTVSADRRMVIDIPQLVASGGTAGSVVNVTMQAHFEGRVGTSRQVLVSRATRPPQVSGGFRVSVGSQVLAQPLPPAALDMLRAQGAMTGRYSCTMQPRVFVFTPAQGATLRFVQ